MDQSPASDFTQRWRDGSHSFRHRSEGGFDRHLYEIGPLNERAAKAFVKRHHYSASFPAALQRYGLFERSGLLVGVAVLSSPVQPSVLTNVFPGLEPYGESAELGRFVLLDRVPANAETFFLAEAFRQAAALGTRGIVSFSDPVPRRSAGGELILAGHVGTIYQASNATYLGRATPRTIHRLPDGTVLNDRAAQKIRKHEKGWEYVERDLMAFGARALEQGEPGAKWLKEALSAVGAQKFRHQGNHRYAFALGNRRQRKSLEIRGDPQAYPKHHD